MTEFEKASNAVNKDETGNMLMNENCIEWLKGSTVATVSICQKKMINKIRKYAEEYPDLFQIVSEKDGVVVAHIPISAIRITHVSRREMSESEKEAAKERLALAREQRQLNKQLEKEEEERAAEEARLEEEEAKREAEKKTVLYKVGDVVHFKYGPIYDMNGNVISSAKEVRTGVIEIVDAHGTFEQNEEPSYDIFIKEDNTLYKHIRQSLVVEKV